MRDRTGVENESEGRRALIVDAVRRNTPRVRFSLDAAPVEAYAGQSVLAAVLLARNRLRTNEFSGEPRAGFCLMGACQDCWVWLADGSRIRACTTPLVEGMAILTAPPAGFPHHG